MTLHWAAVAAAVAALDIPGIKLLDLDEMPQGLTGRPLPVLAPSASVAFLTDWTPKRLTPAGNYRNVYTLNYTLYQSPFAAGRGLAAQFPETVASAEKVINAIQSIVRVDGCKRIELSAVSQVGIVIDASQQQFHGAAFALRVTEF